MANWTPHSYQERAIKMMLGQAAVGLFMKPGLGKTSTTLAAYKLLKDAGYVDKMLLIAPLRPAYNVWPDEIAKWDMFNGITYSIVHGPRKEEALAVDADIYIINPEGVLWLFDQASGRFERGRYDVLCIDESTKFKNSQSKRFKLLKKCLSTFSRRWILTGSPQPRGIMDLFAQIYLLDEGNSLGRYITHFRSKYFYQPNPYKRQYDYVPHEWAFDDIVERIDPLVIQINTEDHLTMPELIRTNVVVSLPEKAKVIYEQVEDDFISQLDEGLVVAQNAAAAGTKCRQIANGAVYIETGEIPIEGGSRPFEEVHTNKIEALQELVEEINEPVLIAYEFQHDVERIKQAFPSAAVIAGGTSAKDASETIRKFNAGMVDVLVGHPASMGHGLNLQAACSNVIFFGITWNFEYYEQFIGRVWRQGQANDSVMVYHIVCAGTLDERVVRVLQSKELSQKKLLEAISDK